MSITYIKVINGIPTVTTKSSFCEVQYFSSGLAANTDITLTTGSFTDSGAKDTLITINGRAANLTTDFVVVGAGPTYTKIQFIYALQNDTTIVFKQGL